MCIVQAIRVNALVTLMDALVGMLMIRWGSWLVWRKSEEFARKNVIRVLSGEVIMCVKYMV